MRDAGKVQDGLYSRFIERLPEIGAYGDIEAVHTYWAACKEAEKATAAAAAEAAKQALNASTPPPPPPPPTKQKRTGRSKANA